MKLQQLKEIINGTVILENNPNQDIAHVFSTDLMSDALAQINNMVIPSEASGPKL